ncbi:Metallo-hydrolase/oxidoreductase [Mycena galericulata]|nr:Metallo-hydrolase/oxidoreductase [Mycena galericulata]
MASLALPAPGKDQAYMHVSALEAGIIHLPLDRFVSGESSGTRACPSLAFFLKHSHSGRRFVFDLGLRRATESYPPLVRTLIQDVMPIDVPQDAAESCAKGGVDPADVDTVILSHIHFDHIGEPAPFTKATFVLGEGAKGQIAAGYPKNEKSKILVDTTPAERTTFLASGDFSVGIGPFPRAMDYYGDGSVYILDTPGHCAGHITVLARTSSDGAWIFLGGDIAHDTRLITGAREIATTDSQGVPRCAHADPVKAAVDIGRARALLALPRVQVLIAHDSAWYAENLRKEEGSPFLPGKIPPL